MKKYRIAVLEGDGIGPEVMREAIKVVKVIEAKGDIEFALEHVPFGGRAYLDHGASFPEETKRICDEADAILKGPIGLSYEESQQIPVEQQPARGALLPLRKRYNIYANFRPVYLPPELAHFSPLKPRVVEGGVNIMMVRELVGGLYFGSKERGASADGGRYVKETLEYDEGQIRRILVVAFEEARKRKKLLHSIHKSNVLMSSVLWNTILDELTPEYPDVEVRHLIVDAAATAMCLNPRQFDVMIMENMFGDILMDLAGGLIGSLGFMPSACIGTEKAYYEPAQGPAPDIAGKGIANPYCMIGSVALMFERSFDMEAEARAIWDAMLKVFADGYTTPDLGDPDGRHKAISTGAFGDKVAEALQDETFGEGL